MTEPRWLTLARAEIGVLEKVGPGSNPKVIQYFKDVGRPDVTEDATAWCAAFLGAMLVRAGVEIPKPSKALAAISYETWGERLDAPILGCIAVKRRTGGEAWNRHVTFVVAANQTTIWGVGGNQSDSVSIAPFSRWQFTAWRWAPGFPRPTAPLPTAAPGKAGSEA